MLRLKRLYPGSVIKEAAKIILVPAPTTRPFGGQPLRDTALLDWSAQVVSDIFT